MWVGLFYLVQIAGASALRAAASVFLVSPQERKMQKQFESAMILATFSSWKTPSSKGGMLGAESRRR
ncbi:MAG: hypothetical protein ACK5SA_07385, partial [Planctomycetota bacterium]